MGDSGTWRGPESAPRGAVRSTSRTRSWATDRSPRGHPDLGVAPRVRLGGSVARAALRATRVVLAARAAGQARHRPVGPAGGPGAAEHGRACSSPTSSAPRSARPSLGMSAGAHSSPGTTRPSGASSSAGTVERSTRRETGSWPRSTVRRARSATAFGVGSAVRALGLDVRSGVDTGELEIAGGRLAGRRGAHRRARRRSRRRGRGRRLGHCQRPRRRVGVVLPRPE